MDEPATTQVEGTTTVDGPETAQISIAGDLERAVVMTVADLRGWPQRTLDVRFVCGRVGEQRHVYTGPPLVEVVLAAGPRFDPVIGKDRTRFLVAVTGRDRHVAVVSWGEIDPGYGDGGVLLATCVDGRDLDGEGPQLVVPRDVAGGRYVSQVVSIWAGSAAVLARA